MRFRLISVYLLLALACNGATPGPSVKGSSEGSKPKPTVDLPQLPADSREKILAQGMKMMLEGEHLLHRKIDDELSKKAFDEYIEALDPGKLFLLSEDVDKLRVYTDQLDDQLGEGDLELAHIGAALLKKRQKVVAKIVRDRLAKPFDFDIDETTQTDPEKLDFAKSDEELADRWRKVLKLQVLERVARMDELTEALAKAKTKEAKEAAKKALAKLPEGQEAREKKAAEELAKNYDGRFRRLAKVEPLEPSESFFNAVAAVFDPHTRYLAPADKDNFDIQMSGSLEGIGAVLSEDDHYIRVQEIVPGGASYRQGKLEEGDLILAVAQDGEEPVDVADMRINKVVQMIRGPKGTKVTLTVKKPDDSIEIITITRDVVEIEAAYARGAILDGPDGNKLGYVSLSSFYGNTRARPGRTPQRNSSDDLKVLFKEMEKRKVPGVILDLRGNGGGLLDHARVIAGLFIPTGPVVQTKYPNERSQVLSDDDPSVVYTGEVVVLVNRFSASASEIVAGALQDYDRAVVIGTGPTHGKGTVQMLFDLNRLRGEPGPALGVLKLTIQQFYRINGESTQYRGVVPDILLPDPVGHLETRERNLDNAIPWNKVDPLQYTTWTNKSWKRSQLAASSKARVGANELFSKIQKRSSYLDKRRKETVVPLKRSKWLARRKSDRKALEEADPKLDEAPKVLTPRVINYTGKPDKVESNRIKEWKKSVSRDPWLLEARNVLSDMIGQAGKAAATSP